MSEPLKQPVAPGLEIVDDSASSGTVFDLKCSNCGNRAGSFVNGLCPGCQYCLGGSGTDAIAVVRLQTLREVKERVEKGKDEGEIFSAWNWYDTLTAWLDEMINAEN